MLSFLQQYARNVHSQNGESGIIDEALRRVGIEHGHCVEIGCNDGLWLSNTAHLMERGWTATYVEADYELYQRCVQNWSFTNQVHSQCCKVDGRNINAFVDERCDVLSLDTDGSDYAIFYGLQVRPAIVIVEIDSSIEPPGERVNPDGGVGYWIMMVAALERGYMLVAHTGNLVLVRQEYGHLFPECGPHPLLEWELYFNRAWVANVICPECECEVDDLADHLAVDCWVV